MFLAGKMITRQNPVIALWEEWAQKWNWRRKWCIIVSCICSFKMKMGVKLKADYGAVLHMPVLKEGKDRISQLPGGMQGHQGYAQPGEDEANTARYPQYDDSRLIENMEKNKTQNLLIWSVWFFSQCHSGDDPEYLITGTHAYPSGPGKYYAINLNKLHACDCSEPIQWTASALFECSYQYFSFNRSILDRWHKDAQESKWGRSPLHGAGFAALTSQVNLYFPPVCTFIL